MRREWGVKEGKESDIYKNWWKEIKNVLIHFSSSLQFDKTCMILFLLLLLHDINSVEKSERERREGERKGKDERVQKKMLCRKGIQGGRGGDRVYGVLPLDPEASGSNLRH